MDRRETWDPRENQDPWAPEAYQVPLAQLEEEVELVSVVLPAHQAHLVSLVHPEVEVCPEQMDLLVLRVNQEIVVQKDHLALRESKETLVPLVSLDFKDNEAHLADKDLWADKGNFLIHNPS